MRRTGDEQDVEVPVWESRDHWAPIERKFEVFGPSAWAQWSSSALDRDRCFVEPGVQIFRLDQSTDRIEDITMDVIQELSFGRLIRGCHRLPNQSLVIAVNLGSFSERGTAFIKVDGNGYVQCDRLRIPYPVETLGSLHRPRSDTGRY